MIPGGVATPLAQAAGGAGDLAINAFVPVVVTGESISRVGGINNVKDILQMYIPFIGDLSKYWDASSEQVKALTQGETTQSQIQDYYDHLRQFDDQHAPMATAFGYGSSQSLYSSGSPIGQSLSQERQQLENELATRYPSGFRSIVDFQNKALLNQKSMYDLAQKPNRSGAEDAILHLAQIEQDGTFMMQASGLPKSISDGITSGRLRTAAMKYRNDRRFMELYDRLFAPTYGPIEVNA